MICQSLHYFFNLHFIQHHNFFDYRLLIKERKMNCHKETNFKLKHHYKTLHSND